MPDLEDLLSGISKTRRNLIKAGVIGASAAFARLTSVKQAVAENNHDENNSDRDDNDNDQSRYRHWHRFRNCFLKGTMIRTADGDRKVEDLAVGDLLPTVFGGIRPIQWIGRYPFKRSDPGKGWVKDVLPVRVGRSALGPDVPYADLYVTKPHSLFIDGILVPVCNLINGTTITVYDARELDELMFFHIKLKLHDVIYAEGVPCETLLNVDESAINFAEYFRHYGMPIIKDARCAPWVGFGPRVEIKSHFRSAISPWIDRRQKLDIIRDELEKRGTALLQQSEFV
jgi:Hint domain